MIINSLNIHSSSYKTGQIMSRYRLIAPKPQLPINPILDGPSTPEKTHQSPFFRNLSPYLQTKPSKAKKRGKSGISPSTRKRAKTHSCDVASLAKSLPLPGFGPQLPRFRLPSPAFDGNLENLITLPLLPCPAATAVATSVPELHGIKRYAQFDEKVLHCEVPQNSSCMNVITPQPVRPIGSSISVGCISEDPSSNSTACVSKKAEEVEAEVESDDLPAVVSDSKNRVRLANSAYKEMVGQPECLWLDLMATYDGQLRGSSCKRISGEVMLDLSDSPVTISSNGFSCRVRIEWGSNGQKSSVSAPCDVMRLSCESKDYLFTWRFHTREASKCNNSKH